MPIHHTLLHLTNFRNPFLQTLIPSIGVAFAMQGAVAIPSIFAQSEQFYDLSGSLTYLSVTALSLYLPTLRARAAATIAGTVKPAFPSIIAALNRTASANGLNWRQVVLSAAVGVWATRLGSYLFQRIMSDGEDSRFKNIRSSPPRFLVAFTAQATWVSLCLMPVLAMNSIPHTLLSTLPFVKATDILGLTLFLSGLTFEIIADRQKNAWVQGKKNKEHDEVFLTRGLWSKSRHPNYFGESMLWTGIAVTAAGVLVGSVGQKGMGLSGGLGKVIGLGVCAVSPAFVTFLLLKVSGVPMSEGKFDKKYGNRRDYQEWKKNTPMFIPKF